jgi:transcriptional regulator with XRE-family HTH domain
MGTLVALSWLPCLAAGAAHQGQNQTKTAPPRFRATHGQHAWHWRIWPSMHELRILCSHFASLCAIHVYMTRFEALATELLRAVRGRRSQRAFSRRLGYRSNIAYRWESGRCFPTARVMLRAMTRLGADPRAALRRFYGTTPAWLEHAAPTSREGVARMLDDLRGRTSIVELARKTGFSRHQVARWLSSATEPKLPEWLALIDASSWWLRKVQEHVAGGDDVIAGYNLFSISRRDYARLQELYLAFYHQAQELIARSSPNERVGLLAAQLFLLDRP